MYGLFLLLHSYNRWLVLVALIGALYMAWTGWRGNRQWGSNDMRVGRFLVVVATLQFLFGLVLYVLPSGLAQAALSNMRVAMETRELRVFGFEHPLQMVIAVGVIHLGWSRSRKAVENARKFRWAAVCYTLAAFIILTGIPWWRPLLRGL